MTPNEALEQVRARLERHMERSRGRGRRSPTADRLAADALAILDAVTPEPAPVTVETVETVQQLGALDPELFPALICPDGVVTKTQNGQWLLEHGGIPDPEMWFPATVLTPATPERTVHEREAAVERVAEVVSEHSPYLDETAVYVGGCNGCDWQEPEEFRYWVDNSTHPEHVARAAIAAILDAVTPEVSPWEGVPDDYERTFFEAGFRMGRDRAATALTPATPPATEQEREAAIAVSPEQVERMVKASADEHRGRHATTSRRGIVCQCGRQFSHDRTWLAHVHRAALRAAGLTIAAYEGREVDRG